MPDKVQSERGVLNARSYRQLQLCIWIDEQLCWKNCTAEHMTSAGKHLSEATGSAQALTAAGSTALLEFLNPGWSVNAQRMQPNR